MFKERKFLKAAILIVVFNETIYTQSKQYTISDYGAAADGQTDNTIVIQKVIDKAAANGGGRVIVPEGKFVAGVIYLKSGIELYLSEGAELLGSTNRADYGTTPAKALINADKLQNISITGKGTIDGRGRELVKDIFRMLKEGTLEDPEWKIKRPREINRPKIISFINCSNVNIKGITIKNSSAWVQSYNGCNNLTIDSVTVKSTAYWNNDGINIVSCKDVRITNCNINAADDGIVFKSEGEFKGFCENVFVENCTIRSSASAFKFGTGSYGGFKNFIVRNLTVYDTYRSAIALECVDGGIIEDIDIRNVKAKNTGNAILIRLGHRNQTGEVGQLQRVYISDVIVEVPKEKPDKGYEIEGPELKYPHNIIPSSITGVPGHPVKDVTLENIEIIYGGGASKDVAFFSTDSLTKVPENESGYPEFSMFGELPAWGFYVRHAENIKMKNIKLSYREDDFRPSVIFDDVKELKLKDISIPTVKELPVVIFNDVKDLSMDKIDMPVDSSKGIEIRESSK